MNKEPKIVSNFDKTTHLGISIVSCRVFDLMALKPEDFYTYTEPIYIKFNGMYGYLSVSGHKVFFFWCDNISENGCWDDVSEKFRVDYVFENGK